MVWIVNDATIKGSESLTSFKQAIYFVEGCGFRLYDTMIYKKNSFPIPTTNRYYAQFEYMFIFSKGKPKAINLIRDRPNKNAGKVMGGRVRRKDGILIEKHGTGKITKDFGIRGNIWEYSIGYMQSSKDKIAFQHPAIFPESLARDHILSWTNEGDTVLDCFMGSGTVGKMCRQLNRNFIGIEKDEKYFQIAKERIGV